MYGRALAARIPERKWYEPSPYITTFDDFGNINTKALDAVQEAYLCCADQLPAASHPGDVWLCAICDRIWAVPSDHAIGNSWTLTRLKYVDKASKDVLALRSYHWGHATFAVFIVSILLSIAVFVISSGVHPLSATYISSAFFAVGVVITAFIASRWRKLSAQYNLSISDN
jgi:hypothetical protein